MLTFISFSGRVVYDVELILHLSCLCKDQIIHQKMIHQKMIRDLAIVVNGNRINIEHPTVTKNANA